ncbi:MAG: hypothetical protein COA49_08060 [Bacteroidetes bacterium]|nr:MAG: hypothetical protein COA49_08060 [Bacteroidota bacterium]
MLFVILELIALNWVISTHALPRGRLASVGMEYAESWTDVVGRITHFKYLEEINVALLMENARLRTENLYFHENQIELDQDSISNTHNRIQGSWNSIPAEIIRSSNYGKNNIIIANRGSSSGITPGMGMLDNGNIAGLVTEVTEHQSLVMPIIHLGAQWSARLGEDGAVGIMVWDGKDIEFAILQDIPLSELILPGDPVITSGFQGTFPAGITVGKVEEVMVTHADKFQSIKVRLGANFNRIHFVEFLRNTSQSETDSLLNFALSNPSL